MHLIKTRSDNKLDKTEKIIKGCVAGKPAAQEKLYKLFSKKMFGLCMMYTKDISAAEDVLQEGFIKVFGKIKQYKHKGSFEGWIRRIMINTALEKFRKQNWLFPVNEVEDYMGDQESYHDIASEVSARDLMKLIHELTPQYRVVFVLYAIEGYSHKEISQQLGISEGTSKSNLSRARKILQEKVEENYFLGEKQNIKRC